VELKDVIRKYEALPTEELEKIIDDVISSNLDEIRKRKDKAVNLIMSKVMSKVKGRAEGKVILELIKSRLKNVME